VDIATRNEKYVKYVHAIAPKNFNWKSLIIAFVVGGFICVIGQGFYMLYEYLFPNYTKDQWGGLVASTLIFIAAVLTGLGIYDKFGTWAGAGALVPITGFSNGVTAAAMEHRKEGIVFGTCANMFKIAGPVIVFGLAMSMLVGLIYWVVSLFV